MSNNYTVYGIFHKSQNNYCYVGKTREKLNIRFIKHCNEKSKALSKLIVQYGRNDFNIQPINDNTINLSEDDAADLEKKYIREYNKIYPLLNKQLYNDPPIYKGIIPKLLNLTNEEISKLDTALKCINTGEIFPSPQYAAYKYNIDAQILMSYTKQKPNISIGYDENNMPLHWILINYKYNINQNITYRIYIIYQLINNQWIPIYAGMTSQTLRSRFNSHCRNYERALYNIIKKYGKDKFKIELAGDANIYDNIIDKNIALQLEEELIKNLQIKYKLYNKYIGQHPQDYHKKLHQQNMIKANERQHNENYYINSARACICVETNKVYKFMQDIAREFNISKNEVFKITHNIIYDINNLHFHSIDLINEQNNTYNIYAILYNNDILYIYYTNYNNIHKASNDNDNEYINYLYSQYNNQLIYKPLYLNIDTEEQAINLRNYYYSIITILNNIRQNKKVNYIEYTPLYVKINYNMHTLSQKIINNTSIICINDNKVYNNFKDACTYYNIPKLNMIRHLQGNEDDTFSYKLNTKLQFRFNNLILKEDNNIYHLYYLLYKNVPVMVLYSRKLTDTICTGLFSNNAIAIQKMQEYDKENFSLQLVIKNIKSLNEAKVIKYIHMILLCMLNYKLFSIKL